jgi:hypothetical protein
MAVSTCTLVDKAFVNTGWDVVKMPGPNCGRVTQLTVSVQSLGDPYDRIVLIARNNCEIARFITPFDTSMQQTESVSEPISSIAASGEVDVVFTTYGAGGYHLLAQAVGTGESPVYYGIPLWFNVHMGPVEDGNAGNTLSATVDWYIDGVVLNFTGHSSQEFGGCGKTFRLYINGNEVWSYTTNTFPCQRWLPGVGFVPPIIIKWSGYAHDIKLTCDNCGSYWVVSAWAFTTQPPPTQQPWVFWLALAAVVLTGVGIGVGIAVSKR